MACGSELLRRNIGFPVEREKMLQTRRRFIVQRSIRFGTAALPQGPAPLKGLTMIKAFAKEPMPQIRLWCVPHGPTGA